jgi:hypothetical protein
VEHVNGYLETIGFSPGRHLLILQPHYYGSTPALAEVNLFLQQQLSNVYNGQLETLVILAFISSVDQMMRRRKRRMQFCDQLRIGSLNGTKQFDDDY